MSTSYCPLSQHVSRQSVLFVTRYGHQASQKHACLALVVIFANLKKVASAQTTFESLGPKPTITQHINLYLLREPYRPALKIVAPNGEICASCAFALKIPIKKQTPPNSKAAESQLQQASMDVENVFHMTGGVGLTSYARNSSLQKKASDMVKNITLEAIQELYLTRTPKSLGIADLGCSSGPNTLSIIREIIEAVEGVSRKTFQPSPEFRVYLNDLPSNDFNSIFQALPDFSKDLNNERNNGKSPSIYIGAYPGSFYGRLFPNISLHFVYSSYSLHWLSRVPPELYRKEGKSINKGSVYISESSPVGVSQAYLKQFQEDFTSFLKSRSEELAAGGRMVLILLGRSGPDHVDRGNCFFWQLLSQSIAILVSKGEVEEEKLDSYDVHFYAPSRGEIEDEVRKEGSFELDRFEMFGLDQRPGKNNESYGTSVAMTVRAIQESMIGQHFGEGILDSLFENFGRLVDEEAAKEEIKPITFGIVLRKL